MYRCRIDIVNIRIHRTPESHIGIFRSRVHGNRDLVISWNGNRYVPILGSAIVKRSVRGHRAKNRSDHLLHREQKRHKNNEGRVNNSRSAHQYMYICVCVCGMRHVREPDCTSYASYSLPLSRLVRSLGQREESRSEHWPSIYEIRFFSPQNTCFRCGRRPHK